MTPTSHAVLLASGAHRWLNCPPSALVEVAYRSEHGDVSSPAAMQGTVAHELAEWKVRQLDERLAETVGVRPVHELIDSEMERCTDEYQQLISERIAAAKRVDESFVVAVEQRLNFSHLVPGGFGAADCIIIAGNLIEVIDFKYGQGVLVEAEQNPQLMLYALGALHHFGPLYDLETVRLTIVQPRREQVSVWETEVSSLEAWGCEKVAPTASLAAAGDG